MFMGGMGPPREGMMINDLRSALAEATLDSDRVRGELRSLVGSTAPNLRAIAFKMGVLAYAQGRVEVLVRAIRSRDSYLQSGVNTRPWSELLIRDLAVQLSYGVTDLGSDSVSASEFEGRRHATREVIEWIESKPYGVIE